MVSQLKYRDSCLSGCWGNQDIHSVLPSPWPLTEGDASITSIPENLSVPAGSWDQLFVHPELWAWTLFACSSSSMWHVQPSPTSHHSHAQKTFGAGRAQPAQHCWAKQATASCNAWHAHIYKQMHLSDAHIFIVWIPHVPFLPTSLHHVPPVHCCLWGGCTHKLLFQVSTTGLSVLKRS